MRPEIKKEKFDTKIKHIHGIAGMLKSTQDCSPWFLSFSRTRPRGKRAGGRSALQGSVAGPEMAKVPSQVESRAATETAVRPPVSGALASRPESKTTLQAGGKTRSILATDNFLVHSRAAIFSP